MGKPKRLADRSPRCRGCGVRISWFKEGRRWEIYEFDTGKPHRECQSKVKIYSKAEIAEFQRKREAGLI